jgi:hypothetical protein
MLHHLETDGTARIVTIAAVSCLDTYVKQDGTWLIRRRQVMVDWTETRIPTVR